MTLTVRINPVSTHEIVKALLGIPSRVVEAGSLVFDPLPPAFGRPLVSLYGFAPDMVLDIAMNSMKTIGTVLTERLNRRFAESGLELELTDVKLDFSIGNRNLIGVTLELGRLGYASLARYTLPMLPEYLPSDCAALARAVLEIVGEDRERLVNAVMDSLSDEKKAEILRLTLRERNVDICAALTGLAKQNGINIEALRVSLS